MAQLNEANDLVKSNWTKLDKILKWLFEDFGEIMRKRGLEQPDPKKGKHTEVSMVFWKPCLPLEICLFLASEEKLKCLAESHWC
jgi:hypothetical protein